MDTSKVPLTTPHLSSSSPFFLSFFLSPFPHSLALLTFIQGQQIKHYEPHGTSARLPARPLHLLASNSTLPSIPPLLRSFPPLLFPSSPLPPVCLGVRARVGVCVVRPLSSFANIIIIILSFTPWTTFARR